MLHGFVLSELRRILNAGVLRLEIGRLDRSCLDRILNFRFESRDTVARRCEKCEWARVHSDLSRIGRTQVGTVEIRIGVEILRRCAPQNDGGVRPPVWPGASAIGGRRIQQSSLLQPGFGYGAQASAEPASWGVAMMDITVAVGSAARLDLAMMLVVAGTAWESSSRHAARFLFKLLQDSSSAAAAVELGAESPDMMKNCTRAKSRLIGPTPGAVKVPC